jgi:predicted ATPase
MRVLEREHIIASLTEYAGDCAIGEGRLVLISGEAGVGKTTLLEEFAAASGDARWIGGACDDLSTPRPLGPLFDIAAQLGGELADAGRRNAPREDLFATLRSELARLAGLTVLVIEDVHWADESTLDLLRFLGRRMRDIPVLLIVTYRDDGLAPNDPLRVVLGDLARQRTTRRVNVAPLSQRAVAIMAEGSGVAPAELFRLTGGNPFFVTEVVQSGTDDIPPSARDAVQARIATLSEDARNVVQTAALIGTRVDPGLLDAVSSPTDGVLDEVVASGVLVSDHNSLRCRHRTAMTTRNWPITPRRRATVPRC